MNLFDYLAINSINSINLINYICPVPQIPISMIIIADTLLPVIVQQFDAAVHHYWSTGEVKSGFGRRGKDLIRNALGCGITNTIDLRYDFYQLLVKLVKMRITTDEPPTFPGVQKICLRRYE